MGAGGDEIRVSVQARVTNIHDPEQRGRIKVSGEAITADGQDIELDEWIKPAGNLVRGMFFLPQIDDIVEVTFNGSATAEDIFGESFLHNPNFRWLASELRDNEDVAEEFTGEDYVQKEGIKSASGAVLVFDRNPDKQRASLAARVVNLGSITSGEPAVLGGTLSEWLRYLITYVTNIFDEIVAVLTELDNEKPNHPFFADPGEYPTEPTDMYVDILSGSSAGKYPVLGTGYVETTESFSATIVDALTEISDNLDLLFKEDASLYDITANWLSNSIFVADNYEEAISDEAKAELADIGYEFTEDGFPDTRI
jgi:hypothetical protein